VAEGLGSRILQGDLRALARGLRIVEDRREGCEDLMRVITPAVGKAHRVGVTGPPGVGKSTLIDALLRVARARGKKVAVLAVDPSSPLTGGALLGDRLRMGDHATDDGVFLRSMASRGMLGGLSGSTGDALDLLDAAGFDLLLVETAGAGQTDVEVASEAETTLVVLAPGLGDGIQAMKSGMMEIADYWVINKGDDPRAEDVRVDVLSVLGMASPTEDMDQRVLVVSARDHTGIEGLLDLLDHRGQMLLGNGEKEVRRRRMILRRIGSAIREQVEPLLDPESAATGAIVDEILSGRLSTRDAAIRILESGTDGLAGGQEAKS